VSPSPARYTDQQPDPQDDELCYELTTEEVARQARIDSGIENACAACGCSDTRACEGGCVWATETLCSRCV